MLCKSPCPEQSNWALQNYLFQNRKFNQALEVIGKSLSWASTVSVPLPCSLCILPCEIIQETQAQFPTSVLIRSCKHVLISPSIFSTPIYSKNYFRLKWWKSDLGKTKRLQKEWENLKCYQKLVSFLKCGFRGKAQTCRSYVNLGLSGL